MFNTNKILNNMLGKGMKMPKIGRDMRSRNKVSFRDHFKELEGSDFNGLFRLMPYMKNAKEVYGFQDQGNDSVFPYVSIMNDNTVIIENYSNTGNNRIKRVKKFKTYAEAKRYAESFMNNYNYFKGGI